MPCNGKLDLNRTKSLVLIEKPLVDQYSSWNNYLVLLGNFYIYVCHSWHCLWWKNADTFASTWTQMYRGQLRDGSYVAIRCLKLKRNHSTQYFMPHIEMISKLRHHHLVSALGHCFEYYLDDSSVSRVLLVFEYVPNGTLRSWISGK